MSRPRSKTAKVKEVAADYYDSHGVLAHIVDEPVDMALEAELREEVTSGAHKRRLQNLSIKLDPAHIAALRKIATLKAIPYQTLIRLRRRSPASRWTKSKSVWAYDINTDGNSLTTSFPCLASAGPIVVPITLNRSKLFSLKLVPG